MLELYNAPASTCSQKVRLVLAEKELPWTDVRLSFARGEHLTPEYLKLNPNGVMPTLLHDGQPIVDSSVINEYLEEAFPDTRRLVPGDVLQRARMRTWRQYIDEVPTVAVRPLSFNAYFLPIWEGMDEPEFEAFCDRHPLRRDFYRSMGRGGFPEHVLVQSRRRLSETWQRMEQQLASTTWLAGDELTLADLSMAPPVVRTVDLDLHHLLNPFPHVRRWLARLQQRPSFETAFYPGSRDLGPSC
jgi:glutathione S-transferase